MKFFLAIATSLLFAGYAQAQQQPKVGCVDRAIRIQAEQLKHDFKAQGLTATKDMMLGMTSKQDYPLAVELKAGELYQLIFTGSREAERMGFVLYDTEGKLIEAKELNEPAKTNFMVYSFTPEKTGRYTLNLRQNLKKRELCGSFIVMEQDRTNKDMSMPVNKANKK